MDRFRQGRGDGPASSGDQNGFAGVEIRRVRRVITRGGLRKQAILQTEIPQGLSPVLPSLGGTAEEAAKKSEKQIPRRLESP